MKNTQKKTIAILQMDGDISDRGSIIHSMRGFGDLLWVRLDVDWLVKSGDGFAFHECGSEWRSWVPTKNLVLQ